VQYYRCKRIDLAVFLRLTHWISLLEKNADSRSAGQDIPSHFVEPECYLVVPILSHFNPVHTLIPYFCKVCVKVCQHENVL
jgi:hypothetical protein